MSGDIDTLPAGAPYGDYLDDSNGSIVLSSTADSDRLTVANKVVPHAIAMAVVVLNRAAERF